VTRKRAILCLLFLYGLACGISGAQATPSFTLTASNTTMPLSGVGSIPYTLTSVNGFSGTIYIGCSPPTEPAGVTIPICEVGGPVIEYALNSNETLKESIGLLASEPVPTPVRMKLPKRRGGIGLALAGALMLGFGLRRKRASHFARLCFAVSLLGGLTALGACAGGQKTLTPGSYTYTLTANEGSSSSPLISAAVTVTVPAGIVVQQ
jgi:hypothetical protein